MFSKFFRKNNSHLNQIISDVNTHKKNVEQIIEKIKIGQDFQSNYINVLMEICQHFEFLIYKKDKNNLYQFSNIYHCVNFFKLEPECVNNIMNRSDLDIMNSYRERTGKEHTFLDICQQSDKIVEDTLETQLFIKGGLIGNEKLIFYDRKIPIIEKDKYNGLIGMSTMFKSNRKNRKKIEQSNYDMIEKKDKYNFLYQHSIKKNSVVFGEE